MANTRATRRTDTPAIRRIAFTRATARAGRIVLGGIRKDRQFGRLGDMLFLLCKYNQSLSVLRSVNVTYL